MAEDTKGTSTPGEGGPSRDMKGKDKETTFTSRLQHSAKALAQSVLSSKDLPSSVGSEKPVSSSSATDQGSTLYSETPSYGSGTARGESIRTQQLVSEDTNDAFNEFLAPASSAEFGSAIARQQMEDGADVAQILSIFDEEPSYDEEFQELSLYEASRLRETVFQSGDNSRDWTTLLDFTPAFVSNPAAMSVEAEQHLGTSDPGVARDVWLRHWGDVLSSYTDQVWGDLSPLVDDAKQEINDLSGQSTDEVYDSEPRALRRLQQILAHVRGTE